MIRPTMSHAVKKDDLHRLMGEYATYLEQQLAKANKRADYYMKLITSDIGYEHAKDLEKGIIEEIENRDNREEWLDKLSVEITRYFGVDIGEHSSANNPWVEAFEAIPEDTLNKFAIEKKIEALELLKHKAVKSVHKNWIVNPMNGVESPGVDELMKQSVGLSTTMIDSLIEQLRKELD